MQWRWLPMRSLTPLSTENAPSQTLSVWSSVTKIASEIQNHPLYSTVWNVHTPWEVTEVEEWAPQQQELIAKVYSDKIPPEVKGWRIHVLTTTSLQHATFLFLLPFTLKPKLGITLVHGNARFAYFFRSKILKSFLYYREGGKKKGYCQKKKKTTLKCNLRLF